MDLVSHGPSAVNPDSFNPPISLCTVHLIGQGQGQGWSISPTGSTNNIQNKRKISLGHKIAVQISKFS